MANETIYTGIAHPTDIYSDAISAALIETVVALPLIYKEDLPFGSVIKYVKKDGYLTSSSSAVTEAVSYSTNSQYATTGIAITAIKDAVCSWLSVEAEQFVGVDQALLATKQGQALGRRLDDEILALIASFTKTVTATAKLTAQDVMDAAYSVRKFCLGASNRKLTALLDYKGVHELRSELLKTAASVFTMPAMISLLGGDTIPANGYVGDLPGVEVFNATGFPTGGGDNSQLVFDRDLALAGVYSAAPKTMFIQVGSGNPSFGTEVSSYIFHGAAIWNDFAGCIVKSDS
jgi:hypothetical protein